MSSNDSSQCVCVVDHIIQERPEETTQPGMARRLYYGHTQTQALVSEAYRCINEIQLSTTLDPGPAPARPSYPPNYNTTQLYQGEGGPSTPTSMGGGSSPVTSVHQVEHRQITFRRSRALARATSSTQGPACPRHPFNQIIHRHIRRLNHMNQANAAWMTLVSTQVRLLCPLMALTGDLRRIQKRVVRAVLMEGMHFTMAHH